MNSAASGWARRTAFYGTGHHPGFAGPFPNGINYADYNTWNIGIGFTYKVFTLDFRYSDTNLSQGDCNAFTSDFSTAQHHAASYRHHPDQSGLAWVPTGAAQPASSSSRPT